MPAGVKADLDPKLKKKNYIHVQISLSALTFEGIMHVLSPIIEVNVYFQHLSAYVPSPHCSHAVLKSAPRNALHLPSGASYTQSGKPSTITPSEGHSFV